MGKQVLSGLGERSANWWKLLKGGIFPLSSSIVGCKVSWLAWELFLTNLNPFQPGGLDTADGQHLTNASKSNLVVIVGLLSQLCHRSFYQGQDEGREELSFEIN